MVLCGPCGVFVLSFEVEREVYGRSHLFLVAHLGRGQWQGGWADALSGLVGAMFVLCGPGVTLWFP